MVPHNHMAEQWIFLVRPIQAFVIIIWKPRILHKNPTTEWVFFLSSESSPSNVRFTQCYWRTIYDILSLKCYGRYWRFKCNPIWKVKRQVMKSCIFYYTCVTPTWKCPTNFDHKDPNFTFLTRRKWPSY